MEYILITQLVAYFMNGKIKIIVFIIATKLFMAQWREKKELYTKYAFLKSPTTAIKNMLKPLRTS